MSESDQTLVLRLNYCPSCNRVYWKDNSFCLDDGTPLVSAASYNPSADTEEMTSEQRLDAQLAASTPLDRDGIDDWQYILEYGMHHTLDEVVKSAPFLARYPSTLSTAEFVDRLCADLNKDFRAGQRNALIMSLESGMTRAQVLRKILEI